MVFEGSIVALVTPSASVSVFPDSPLPLTL